MYGQFLSWCGVLFTGVLLLSACAEQKGPAGPNQKLQFEGWVSSGGDLTADSHNPWWVQNTTEVTYCIAIDAEGVKANAEEINEAFLAAVGYWKKDFETFHTEYKKKSEKKAQARVALQKFTKVDCDKNPDLKLAFGYGALDAREKMYISDPTKVVSRAVRTFYNREELKGRGFIYFGAEFGQSAIAKSFLPQLGKLKESMAGELWTFHGVLWSAMQHESGHLFGVPHIPRTFMDEYYLDGMANAARSDLGGFHRFEYQVGAYYKHAERAQPFFAPWLNIEWTASLSEETRKHLKLNEPVSLYFSPSEGKAPQLQLGRQADLNLVMASDVEAAPTSFYKVARVNLPAEQKVFPSAEELGRNNLVVGGFYFYSITATLENRRLRFELDPSDYSALKIYGVEKDTPVVLQSSNMPFPTVE